MAETTDVSNKIADDVWAILGPFVNTQYTITEPVDVDAVGATHVVPLTTVALSRPLQKDLEDRLAAGKAIITVEPDETDAPSQQYANEGRQMDFVGRAPLTLTATPTTPPTGGNAWTIGLTGNVLTPGNVIGVQLGMLGAAYTVVAGDTPGSIAAGLAAQAVTAGIAGSAVGIVFKALGANPTVRVGATSTWLAAVSRRARTFDVVFWCPDPHLRQFYLRKTDALYRPGQKLALPDGSVATVIGTAGVASWNTRVTDATARDNLFLARTRWLIDFTITKIVNKVPIVAMTVALDAAPLDMTTPLPASML